MWIKRLLALGLTVLIIGTLLWSYWNWYANQQWHAARDAIIAAGYPMEHADLFDEPVPDELNRYLAFTALSDVYENMRQERQKEMDFIQLYGEWLFRDEENGEKYYDYYELELSYSEYVNLIEPWLFSEEIESYLDAHRELLEKPGFYIPPDEYISHIPSVGMILNLSSILNARALFLAEAGKHDEALDQLILLIEVAEAHTAYPSLISYLVYVACLGQTIYTLEHLMLESRLQVHDESVANLYRLIEKLRPQSPALLARALDGERILFGDPFFTGTMSDEQAEFMDFWIEDSPIGRFYTTPLLKPYRKLDHTEYMRYFLKAKKLLDEEPHRYLAEMARNNEQPTEYYLSSLIGPTFKGVIRQAVKLDARLAMAQVVWALEKEFVETGQYPVYLEDARYVHETMRIDPLSLSQSDFYYVQFPDGYLLYSVGTNQVNNGGRDSQDGDIVIRIKREPTQETD